MRKRSGAIDSDTTENYLKLAILSQKQQNIFYTGQSVEDEEEKHEYKPNSRRYSIDIMNFDYDTDEVNNSYQMQSNSFPPKAQNFEKDIFKPKKLTNLKNENLFKRNSKDSINFEENSSNSVFSQKCIEKENLKTYVSKIMVLGEKSTGKKSLINMLFRRSQNLRDDNTSAFTKGLSQNSCFDLICKSVQMNEREKMIYKFWIQNLSNEKFDNIINVYYKTVSLFIFVYDVSKPESLEKIKKVSENIKKSLGKNYINAILVAMNPKNLNQSKIDFSEVEDFKNKANFKEFFKNIYENNENENKKILDFISTHNLQNLQNLDKSFLQQNVSAADIC